MSIPNAPAATAARLPVRMPFRVLAGIFALVGSTTILFACFLIWRDGVQVVRVGDALSLPLMIGFTRLCYHAAAYGRSPMDGGSWPLASSRVAACYAILYFAYRLNS